MGGQGKPEDRERGRPRIAWRLWLGALGVLLLAGLATTYFVRSWLSDTPFAHGETQAVETEDAGVALVSLRNLAREAPDASVDAGTADARIDAGDLSIIDGPSPGNAWARRTKNILLVGVDRRPWGRGAGLADTILLVALDTRSGHVGLVSIPRDYYVEFRPGEFGRINTAFHFARENGMRRGEYLAHVVTTLLDVPIRETVIVDLTVLERAVDAVGGVDVDVPCPIRDNFVDPRTESGRRLLDVPAGRVRMDGATSAMYARSRHGRSDWDRARRQQAVVLALRRRVTSVDALPLMPRLLDELGDHVETDMTRRELLELGRFGLRIDPGNMHGMVLASAASEHFRTPEGWSVLLPNVEAIRAQIRGLFDAPAPGVELRAARCVDVDAALEGRVARRFVDGGVPLRPVPGELDAGVGAAAAAAAAESDD